MVEKLITSGMALFPMIGALLAFVIGKCSEHKKEKGNGLPRDLFVNLITLLELGAAISLLFVFLKKGELNISLPYVCGMGLHFKLDGFRVLYGVVTAFMWAMTTLFSPEYMASYRNKSRYYFFWLMTLGATMGVFYSADLYTTFIFFEVMSLTSYVWIAQEEEKDSLRAAATYLGISMIGGLVMLAGIFILYTSIQTLQYSKLAAAVSRTDGINAEIIAAAICILFGFSVKAGAFPVHIWLPKAHPVAPAPASALLSGVLTKTGVFGIILITGSIFSGNQMFANIFLMIALATMVIGAVLALFSVNLKKVLACSSLSQIGFILTGVSLLLYPEAETILAARGTVLYMVNHSLIKLVLFMAAGVVYQNLHKLNLNDIKGFGRKKPWLNVVFLLGAWGIAGVPFGNGYVSKTLLHEAIVENAVLPGAVEWCFLISGGCTLAYMLKLYICLFIEKNQDVKLQEQFDHSKQYWNGFSKAALTISALVLPVLGVLPNMTSDRIANLMQGITGISDLNETEVFAYFSLSNLLGSGISIAIGIVVYLLLVRLCLMKKGVYLDVWPKWLDLENLIYRPVLLYCLPFVFGVICRVLDSFVDTLVVILRKTILCDSRIPYELEEGNRFTLICGTIADFFVTLFGRKQEPGTKKVSYVHKFAVKREELIENQQIIGRSMSFGLIMFCAGLVFTLGYLLWLTL